MALAIFVISGRFPGKGIRRQASNNVAYLCQVRIERIMKNGGLRVEISTAPTSAAVVRCQLDCLFMGYYLRAFILSLIVNSFDPISNGNNLYSL